MSFAITDVGPLAVGHATDPVGLTGCTAILFPEKAAAGVDVRGSAAGTRAIEQLRKYHVVDRIDGILLAGGSSFGLTATGGVLRYLERQGIGFVTPAATVPIVPSAIVYDLAIGDAGARPDEAMGEAAAAAATREPPAQGSVGAGAGCTLGKIGGIACATRGGFGWATLAGPGELRVGAMVVCNAFGDLIDPGSGRPLAGARAAPKSAELVDMEGWIATHGGPRRGFAAQSTTLAVAVTNACFDREPLIQIAGVMHDGFARVLAPVHTAFDGDVAFACSLGEVQAGVNTVGVLAKRAVMAATLNAIRHASAGGGIPSASSLGLPIPHYPAS